MEEIKAPEGYKFFLLRTTVFGVQDTEQCPEDFLTEVKGLDTLDQVDLNEHYFAESLADIDVQTLHDGGYYSEADNSDYRNGDTHTWYLCLMKESTVFEDKDFTLDCPRECLKKASYTLEVVCGYCSEPHMLSDAGTLDSFLKDGIICDDCGRFIKPWE